MIEKIKTRIKEKIISTLDSDYIRKSKQNPQHVFIQNINKDYQIKAQKRALVSYITLPILKDLDKDIAHTNYREFIQILHVLTKLNFNIDICHYQDPNVSSSFNDKKYDLIIGSGEPFYDACKLYPLSKKILYCTVSYPKSQFDSTKERANYYFERHGLKPHFYWHNYYPDEHFSCANYLFFKGNDEIKKTFLHLKNIQSFYPIISCPFKHENSYTINRDIGTTKNNFLWFGSIGVIRKGLDILVDVFKKHQHLKLHIAGLTDEEKSTLPEFTSNIVNLGFVRLQSENFIKIMNSCSFIIFPSCSEGMASGALTCMNHGLIPIITKECGIDIDNSIGYLLDDYKYETIEENILNVSQLDNVQLNKKQNNVLKHTTANYNLEIFTNQIESYLNEIIN